MKRGDEAFGFAGGAVQAASTGPRFMKRGDAVVARQAAEDGAASTGPRFMKRGDHGGKENYECRLVGFNGAALHEARRSFLKSSGQAEASMLQRGRAS